MPKTRPLALALTLLALAQGGASCDQDPIRVTVMGDSHSDVDREPRRDWLWWTPGYWITDEQAVSGASCWNLLPDTLAGPFEGDVLVVFCGTNDTAKGVWNLETTAAWIEAAVVEAHARGMTPVLVTPPPVLTDVPIPASERNARLEDLRAAILDLETQYDMEVADLYDHIWAQPDIALLFEGDGLHMTLEGRRVAYKLIDRHVRRAFNLH